MTSRASFLIGVDGGGSRCRLAVADWEGRVLARREDEGSANVATDFAGAVLRLRSGLSAVWAAAGQPAEALPQAACCLGLAGVNVVGLGARVQEALPFVRCLVGDDRATSVAGALGFDDGALISAGTGSFVCRQANAETRSLGGYGLFLGDDASGAWLGHRILRRAALKLERVVAPTPLLEDVASVFSGNLQEMIRFSLGAKPRDVAEFAPRVFEAAGVGDPEGLRLVAEGVAYCMDALSALGWRSGEALCLVGGAGRLYAPFFSAETRADLRPPRGSALSGALTLAARLAGVPEAKAFADAVNQQER